MVSAASTLPVGLLDVAGYINIPPYFSVRCISEENEKCIEVAEGETIEPTYLADNGALSPCEMGVVSMGVVHRQQLTSGNLH